MPEAPAPVEGEVVRIVEEKGRKVLGLIGARTITVRIRIIRVIRVRVRVLMMD